MLLTIFVAQLRQIMKLSFKFLRQLSVSFQSYYNTDIKGKTQENVNNTYTDHGDRQQHEPVV